MKLELDVYGGVCETKRFVVNGIKADYKDFGEKYDTSPDHLRPRICGNMAFKPRFPAQKVLDKYGIDINEYSAICQRLKKCISFGACKLCA